MEKDNTTPNPAVTDAPPEDAPPETKMIRPVSNNQNRFGENVNFNNFQAPPPQFNPQFGGGPFNGPYQGGPGPFNGPQSMYTPPGPSPYAMPFQPQGPFGQGPYGQGPYDNGPYQNQNYPPPPQKPIGNPGSYGADNSALQESGMGQLGQFFSSMVSELQNSGFNNNVESAIAPKKPVKKALVPRPPAATTTTTTTQKTTTTPDDSSDS
ncbi:protein lifeguard 1-like [Paramacrobiotus metropolitanus]|uniref:protein lifeguard 1-like n=1 Tax=Paramacrobiotus metropolitanus TaxID=2943436 RepID=UPI002445E9C3|nr:protein lifeguard 1-like [Paramacrobiotus metropolitanus]